MFTVALLGGESTGKSSLALALHRHLSEACSLSATVVPEQLRLWCERMGRAPHAHEQQARADDQSEAVAKAQSQPVDVVIADTTALVVAAYSAHYFNDTSLFTAAQQAQRSCDLTLLMGVDLPWASDGLFRDSPAVRDAVDQLLRDALIRAGLPFQVVSGQGTARLQQALKAIEKTWGKAPGTLSMPEPARALRHTWVCDSCSDPDCEHRLFQGLMAARPPSTRDAPADSGGSSRSG